MELVPSEICSKKGLKEWNVRLINLHQTIQALPCTGVKKHAHMLPSNKNQCENMEVFLIFSIFETLSKELLERYEYLFNYAPNCDVILHHCLNDFQILYNSSINSIVKDPTLDTQVYNLTVFSRVQHELHVFGLIEIGEYQQGLEEFSRAQQKFKNLFKSTTGSKWKYDLKNLFSMIAYEYFGYMDLLNLEYKEIRSKIQQVALVFYLEKLIFQLKNSIKAFIIPPFRISDDFKSLFFTDSYYALSLIAYTFESRYTTTGSFTVEVTKHLRYIEELN
ncbi:hypothetical protein HMI55_000980 [Coelomomyces lativittatus]|nr:hypothetical protein HMI55_000980 [Coelomomyces lativittatus]